jgi:hypothetical protein
VIDTTAVPASNPVWSGPRSTHTTYLPQPITSDVDFIPSTVEPAVPARFERFYLIQGQLSPRLWLTRPIPVRVFIEGGEFVADQETLGIHAFGETVAEAILDLRDEIVEHYERLLALGERVSPRLRREHELLSSVLIPLDGDD